MSNINKHTITDVFFDLDHTLWDFDKNSGLAFELVFQRHKIDMNILEFLKIYEPINYNYWKAYREERVTKEELRRGRLQDSFAALKREIAMTEIDAISKSYIDFLPENNYLLEGAQQVLAYLKPKYNLHIITNGFIEVQNTKMKRSGLKSFFKTVTSSEEVGVKKPNPKVFHYALNKAETDAKNSIMIGDTFEADILGAEKVGMDTIFYNYRKETLPPNYKVVNSLLSLKKIL